MLTPEQAAEAAEWERRQWEPAFERECTRVRRLKTRLDCGHVIDGSESYRYRVWKMRGTVGVEQRTACEPCAHRRERARL